MTDFLLVLTTFSEEADAARAVRTLVEERLVACGNVFPAGRSIYRWEGQVEEKKEVVVLLKTRKQDWTALMSRLHDLHPYQVPECLAFRVAAGSPKYLEWLESALEPEGA